MIEICFREHIINVNILVDDVNSSTTIYSYYPFNQERCKDTTPIVYDRYKNGVFERNTSSFPKKLSNLWMCPLEMVVWEIPGFLSIDNQNEISGIEVRYLETLADIMNFTLKAVFSPKARGTVFENGTITGAFKLINDGIGDVMAGVTLCLELRTRHFACSNEYKRTYFVVLLKRSKTYHNLETLLLPFDKTSWLLILLFFIGKWILRNISEHNSSINFGEMSKRIGIFVWIFSILIIRSSYEGSVFKFMHNRPRKHLPQSFEEANKSGYTFFCESINYGLIQDFTNLSNNLKPLDLSPLQFLEEFLKFDKDEKYAAIIEEMTLGIYNQDYTKLERFYMIKKPILQYPLCLYMPKFSFLTEEFNKHIENLNANGLTKERYHIVVNDELKRNSSKIKPVKVKYLKGTFGFLQTFLGISFGIFILEVFSRRICLFSKIVFKNIVGRLSRKKRIGTVL
ncbi:uncharacterized protein LOC129915852 [Episyrphus balteatus]|uniref:uncharacterized protein LOC129915852 n=1 Tax=Episyrphus balteatus TaxID=286459 RepID=UPI00248549A3|nr:uncharacterized protein LOC129915852 [Episyrphus balteatus]